MDPCPPGKGLISNSFVAGRGHVTGGCWPLEAGQGTGLHPSLDHAGRDECAAERSTLPALGHRHRRNGLTFKPLQRWSPRLGQPRETGWVPPSPTVPAVRKSKLWFSQKEVSTPRINSGDSCAASFPSSVGESLGRAGEAVLCWGPVLQLLSALELAGRRPPPPLGVFRARVWTCGGHGGAAEPGPDPGCACPNCAAGRGHQPRVQVWGSSQGRGRVPAPATVPGDSPSNGPVLPALKPVPLPSSICASLPRHVHGVLVCLFPPVSPPHILCVTTAAEKEPRALLPLVIALSPQL